MGVHMCVDPEGADRAPDLSLAKFSYLHLEHRHLFNMAPPRKWCKFPTPHDQHLFEWSNNGLIYWCKGTK